MRAIGDIVGGGGGAIHCRVEARQSEVEKLLAHRERSRDLIERILLNCQQALEILLLDIDALDVGLIGLLCHDQVDELGRQIDIRALERARFELTQRCCAGSPGRRRAGTRRRGPYVPGHWNQPLRVDKIRQSDGPENLGASIRVLTSYNAIGADLHAGELAAATAVGGNRIDAKRQTGNAGPGEVLGDAERCCAIRQAAGGDRTAARDELAAAVEAQGRTGA